MLITISTLLTFGQVARAIYYASDMATAIPPLSILGLVTRVIGIILH